MIIRSGIFLVAGLLMVLFPMAMISWQSKVLPFLHIPIKPDAEHDLRIIGYVFILVSSVLFYIGIV